MMQKPNESCYRFAEGPRTRHNDVLVDQSTKSAQVIDVASRPDTRLPGGGFPNSCQSASKRIFDLKGRVLTVLSGLATPTKTEHKDAHTQSESLSPKSKSRPTQTLAQPIASDNEPERAQIGSSKKSQRKSIWKRPKIVVDGNSPNASLLKMISERTHAEPVNQLTSPAVSTVDKSTQHEFVDQENSSGSGTSACRCITPLLMERVCDLESKLRRQQKSLKSLQSSVKSMNFPEYQPTDVNMTQSPTGVTPIQSRRHTDDNQMQTPPEALISKNGSTETLCDSGDRTLSEEFIQIFVKAKQKADAINLKPNTSRVMPNFDKLFVIPKIQNSNGTVSVNEVDESSECSTNRDIRRQQVDNLLRRLIEMIEESEKKKGSASKGSQDLQLPKSLLTQQSCEPLVQQLIRLFSNPKTEETKPAAKCDNEANNLYNLFANILSMFFQPSGEESKDNEQESPKNVAQGSTARQPELTMADMDIDSQSRSLSESNSSLPDVIPNGNNSSTACQCGDGNPPACDRMIDRLLYLIGNHSLKDVVLSIMRRPGNVYHLTVREMATGKPLGCLLANECSIGEAIAVGLFEDIHTFCELGKQRTTDPRLCPQDPTVQLARRRERGGVKLDGNDDQDFAVRVLGIPPQEACRLFSLTSALKQSKHSSDQRIYQSAKNSDAALINAPLSSDSESNWRTCGAASSLFFHIVSKTDEDENHE